MRLETVYHLKAIPVVRGFVAECLRFFGGDQREVADMELAAEEAAAHIIENHRHQSLDDVFEIVCDFIPGVSVFRVTMSNKGLPVDAEHLPEYDADSPDSSLDGLNFFLIERFTDRFSMENRGRDGWVTVLDKKVASPTRRVGEGAAGDASGATEDEAPPKGKLDCVMASPEDAYEITKLAYFTYHYTYPKTVFYYPEVLREALSNGSVVSFVSKSGDGEIAAHFAYLRSPYCREIAEAGAAMTRPEYRKSIVVLKLMKMVMSYPARVEDSGISLVESNLVTSHTGSQRLARAAKSYPFALKLSVYDHAEFIDIDTSRATNARESLLYSLWAPKGLEKSFKIYVPEAHMEVVGRLLDNAGLPGEVDASSAEPTAGEGFFDVERKEEFGLATIQVSRVAAGWRDNLKTYRRDLSMDGFSTIHLKLLADSPLPADLDERLTEAGFFFSGVMPLTLDRWMLLYTFLNNQRFDFKGVALCDSMAMELRDYIESRRELVDI